MPLVIYLNLFMVIVAKLSILKAHLRINIFELKCFKNILPCLNNRIVSLQCRYIFLDFNLDFCVILNVVANFKRVIQVDIAHFWDVKSFWNDCIKTVGQGKEKENWFNGYSFPNFLTLQLESLHFKFC